MHSSLSVALADLKKETGMDVLNSQNKEEKKVKEQIGTEKLKSLLEGWLQALNNKEDFELEVNGKQRRVPFKALEEGRLNLEVESEGGENEFELELKWKGRPEETLLKQ